eukprot:2252068-Rhodomonas_salina.1
MGTWCQSHTSGRPGRPRARQCPCRTPTPARWALRERCRPGNTQNHCKRHTCRRPLSGRRGTKKCTPLG